MRKSFAITPFLLLTATMVCNAQSAETITISGNITDVHGNSNLYQAFVVNARTSEGIMAGPGTAFTISALHNDTILFTASGFEVKKVCLKDSTYKPKYTLTVKLDSLHVNLAEVKVYPTKSLREIDDERHHIGEDDVNTKRYNNTHLLSDPISFLYERLSKIEQSKRKVEQLMDEEQKRQVLKELLHDLVKSDIIDMDDNQLDKFLDYLNLSDAYVRTATDYDLLMEIKYRYEAYENRNSYYVPPAGNH